MSVATETDSGTKQGVIDGLARTDKELDKALLKGAREYWYKVWQTARQLCLEYGAYDTGTLYNSIRLVWNAGAGFAPYEVAVSSQGANLTALIRVGGGTYINPKTGRIVDYAAAVHDGTRYMEARPFLMDAIEICEPFRAKIMSQYIDKALTKFERVA